MRTTITQEEFLQRFNNYTNNTATLITPYINKRTKVRIKCNTCGYEWEVSPSSIMYHDNYSFRECPECKYTTCECDYCHQTFKRLKSAVKDHNFCSKNCGNLYKNKEKTNFINSTAYRRNAFLYNEHKCAVCGWDKDERVLEVHHIDENREHNDINNLIILCPTCHKYLTLHLYSLEELFQIKAQE